MLNLHKRRDNFDAMTIRLRHSSARRRQGPHSGECAARLGEKGVASGRGSGGITPAAIAVESKQQYPVWDRP